MKKSPIAKSAFFSALAIIFTAIFHGCVVDNHVKILYQQEGSQQNTMNWSSQHEGLSYTDTLVPFADNQYELFIVKIDPHKFDFHLYQNKEQDKAKSIQEISRETRAPLAFNGAFFDQNFKAMGLLLDGNQQIHKTIKSDLMNGVFAIDKTGTAELLHPELAKTADLLFAIQNGPALVDPDGKILIGVDTQKTAARTALGIDHDGNIILLILHLNIMNTDNALSLYQFAHMLREAPELKPLDLHSVLNLDGGPSTGVIVEEEYFPEINNVQNVIIAVPKS